MSFNFVQVNLKPVGLGSFLLNFIYGDAFLGKLDAYSKTVTWMCPPGGLMAEMYLDFLSKLALCMI